MQNLDRHKDTLLEFDFLMNDTWLSLPSDLRGFFEHRTLFCEGRQIVAAGEDKVLS